MPSRFMVAKVHVRELEEICNRMLPPGGPEYQKWFDKHGQRLKTDYDWPLSQAVYLLRKSLARDHALAEAAADAKAEER